VLGEPRLSFLLGTGFRVTGSAPTQPRSKEALERRQRQEDHPWHQHHREHKCSQREGPVGDLRADEPHENGERRVDREPDDYGELPARRHDVVLRRPRPADKSLDDPLA
jgi:hypothetical protein